MFTLTRRLFGAGLVATAALVSFGASAQELTQFNIGYQKTGLPVIAKQQQIIEKALSPKVRRSNGWSLPPARRWSKH